MGTVRGNPESRVMPDGRFAELNRGIDWLECRQRGRLPAHEASVWRSAMRRMSSSEHYNRTRRIRPSLEDLECRCLLSASSSPLAKALAIISSGGVFSHNDRKFTYATPGG